MSDHGAQSGSSVAPGAYIVALAMYGKNRPKKSTPKRHPSVLIKLMFFSESTNDVVDLFLIEDVSFKKISVRTRVIIIL